MVQPREVSIDVEQMGRHSGQLVRVRGHVDGFGPSEGGQWLRLRDARNRARARSPSGFQPITARRSISRRCVRTTASPSSGSSRGTRTTRTMRSCGSSCRGREPTSSVSATRPCWPTWLLWSFLAAAAAVLGVLALMRINSRRHLRALRETDARYRQLLAMTPEAVIVHTGGRIIFTNPAAADLLGVASEHALVGRSIADFAAPESRDASKGLTDARGGRPPRVRGRLVKAHGWAARRRDQLQSMRLPRPAGSRGARPGHQRHSSATSATCTRWRSSTS